MTRSLENTGFVCLHCGYAVQKLYNGRYRNHCPVCLYSLHVDVMPGDRANNCGGLMRPVGLHYKRKKGWQIEHECLRCGGRSLCRTAEDDPVQPDDLIILMK